MPPQARKPRFDRAPSGTSLDLTARDVELIRYVHEHRFLRSTDLVALVGGSEQKVLRRLQLLYHHGYLDRPRMQLDYYTRGSLPMVYGLGDRGAGLLEARGEIPSGKVSWTAKNRDLGRVFLQHTLFVSEVMVGLELGCRALGRVRLIPPEEILRLAPEETRQQRQPLSWRVRVSLGEESAELGVIPDRVFGLRFEDEPEGRNRAFFFLEADRASMPILRPGLRQTSVFRKLLSYQETWRQGLHTPHLGIRYFRVLTVTTSPERVRHLLDAMERLPGGGSSLFLFADREALRAGNPLLHLLLNGRGETTRLID